MEFYTSDLHLGHAKAIEFCQRPFSSVEEMNEALISRWNAKVTGNDTVYVLGDLYLGSSTEFAVFGKRLKGNIVLLRGNHDTFATVTNAEYFTKISYMEVRRDNHIDMTLCHYPLLEWYKGRLDKEQSGYLIHGHTHNTVKHLYRPIFSTPFALNAGVDVNGYEPVTFDELIANNIVWHRVALERLATLRENESVNIPYTDYGTL